MAGYAGYAHSFDVPFDHQTVLFTKKQLFVHIQLVYSFNPALQCFLLTPRTVICTCNLLVLISLVLFLCLFISSVCENHKLNLKTINEGIRQLTDLYLICIRKYVG